ncbi:Toll-like receptor 2 type-1 [Collichthys lucidus]|uniref:Toll-like receptor 2 type-1 n=1 Tax=Collichthys lucidus TaxID=240159 RepID=A0A4U5U2X0_COLLU|nr:Toll-like receptor 2 type-1 [Collichthys lucidus]
MKHLHEIVWKNIDIPQFYRFPALLFLQPLLKEARRVSVINSKLFAYPCEFSVGLSKVQYMDISANILNDMSFSNMMCDGEGGLWSLRTINISRNYLRSINSKLFTRLDKLENIDMMKWTLVGWKHIWSQSWSRGRPPLQLCLHKRDFIPGGWILDNIMDAIEKSHKTLFVLSEHFVRSEWCKYELDYTHFRLFDQNDDTVVLILLEAIDAETIPKKFCKLRRFMNSRTYLKWSDDDNQIPRFWKNLRTAIKRPGTNDGNYGNGFEDLQLQDF